MATIKVKEYDLLRYAKPGLKCDVLTERQAEALKRVDRGINSNVIDWQRDGVKFSQFCGVLPLGKDSIEVLPKVHGIESVDGDNSGASRKILIKMLYQAKRLKTPRSGSTGIDIQKHHLLDVFVDHFCSELFSQLHQGVIKTYVSREDNLSVLKGKLMIKEQLRQNLVHKEHFYCRYDEFIEDNAYNQVIKATVRCLFNRVSNNRVKRKLSELLNVFDSVADKQKCAADVDKLPRNRMVKRYNDTFAMCRMFLSGVSPNVITGKPDALSLLFDMNKLFEEFVYRRVAKVASRMGLIAKDQKPQQYLARCTVSDRDMFKMMPDISIMDETGTIQVIIDTKWKLLDPADSKYGISQSDLYQMHAYATQYNCNDIILLYPFHAKVGEQLPSLQIKRGSQRIKIATIDLCALASKSLPSVDDQLQRMLEGVVLGNLKTFISASDWIFAKTYAETWPHEYIVQERVDNDLFLELAHHIDTGGYVEHFFNKEVTYWDYEGYTYWHMENIINRCVVADTYHRRKIDGRLPQL